MELESSSISMNGSSPRVLYGIATCGKPEFEAILQTSLSTWAGTLPREHLVIVGGSHDDALEGLAPETLRCSDEDIGCKEATMLFRAVARARAVDADWLDVGQEDKYIRVGRVAVALSQRDPQLPAAYGGVGCGMPWENFPVEFKPTKTKPDWWPNPHFSCKAVWEKGAICGGVTYLLSRGAMEMLVKPGQTLDDFVNETLSGSEITQASDVMTSCLLYKRGIPIHPIGIATDMRGTYEEAVVEAKVKRLSRKKALIYHLAGDKKQVPEIIRGLYDEDVRRLRKQQQNASSSH